MGKIKIPSLGLGKVAWLPSRKVNSFLCLKSSRGTWLVVLSPPGTITEHRVRGRPHLFQYHHVSFSGLSVSHGKEVPPTEMVRNRNLEKAVQNSNLSGGLWEEGQLWKWRRDDWQGRFRSHQGKYCLLSPSKQPTDGPSLMRLLVKHGRLSTVAPSSHYNDRKRNKREGEREGSLNVTLK